MNESVRFAFDTYTQKGATKLTIGGIIGAMLAIIVGLGVAPAIIDSGAYNSFNSTGTDNAAGALENVSSTSATIVDLIPLIFFVGILVGSLAYFGLSS